MRFTAFGAIVLFSFCALAQVPVDEAKAKLAEKDRQRLAERGQVVQITMGELADLRLKVAQMEGELKALRLRLADKQSPKAFHETIEIGMTREEVMSFIKSHPALRVTGMSADAGVNKATRKTTISRVETAKQNATVARNEGDPTRTYTESEKADTSRIQADTVVSTGKRETIHIGQYGTYREHAGTRRNALGGESAVYENVERETGRMSVTLVDGVVSSVDAR